MERPDADLVAAARRGERDAFAELITRHRPTTLAVTARLLGSQELAGDAVQEATVVAMTALDQLRSADRFGAWLCGIALNVARRWLRELRTVPLTSRIADMATTGGPDEQLEAAELALAVRRAVAGLADGQREAVLLFYLQGLTHREVAADLEISVGAVKARLHQARAALTPKLAPLMNAEEKPMPHAPENRWIDVTVSEVRRDTGDDPTRMRHVIVLRELSGGRQLPIWVGPFEATAVALSLESTETPRPLTYQLTSNLVDAAGCQVGEVRITAMAEGTFYATVVVVGPAGTREVDARPSDALNLALVTGSPIRIERHLLEDPEATGRTEWENYPNNATDIAAQAWQRHEEDLAAHTGAATQSDVPAPIAP